MLANPLVQTIFFSDGLAPQFIADAVLFNQTETTSQPPAILQSDVAERAHVSVDDWNTEAVSKATQVKNVIEYLASKLWA